ncbi:dienelactone hydrolase family protein [Cryptosporangium sp. NPDC048952]|uniref:dienelactone hydrolase family protein n=1 Tax=Cryptosporangium sp. NPDC048952 TaxID=3363961 RepID=UPI00371FF860
MATNRTRTLVFVGADDHLVDAAPIAERLAEEGVDHEVVIYPDTPHGYFCDEWDTWRPAPAADTWAKVTALFEV